MNVRIKKRKGDFTQIQNSALHNASIPLDTLGLFCYLLAHPNNWTANMTAIRKERGIGKDKLQRMFRDLEDCGHARLVTDQDKRTGELLGKHWNVSEEPIFPVRRQPAYPSVGKVKHRQPEDPTVGKPGSDNNSPFLTTEYESASVSEARARMRRKPETYPALSVTAGVGIADGSGKDDQDGESVGASSSPARYDIPDADAEDRYSDPGEAGLPPSRSTSSTTPGSNLDEFLEPEDYAGMLLKASSSRAKPRPCTKRLFRQPMDGYLDNKAHAVRHQQEAEFAHVRPTDKNVGSDSLPDSGAHVTLPLAVFETRSSADLLEKGRFCEF